jgi:hypothetical protein
LAELGIVAAKGDKGVKELLSIVADEKDARLPIDARASVIVLAAQLQAEQTLIGSIEKRLTGVMKTLMRNGRDRRSENP